MFRIPQFLKIVLAAIVMCAMTTAGAGMASAAPLAAAPVAAPAMASPAAQAQSAGLAATSAGLSARVLPTVSGECKSGRCVVKLSHAETKAMGAGKFLTVPAWVPAVLRPVLTLSIKVHAWIAKQYAKKGLCSQFVLDIRPWASQGYMSRKC